MCRYFSIASLFIYFISFGYCFVLYPPSTTDQLQNEYLKICKINEIDLNLVTFSCSSCFLTVTNFCNVDITNPFNMPVLLRNHVPITTIFDKFYVTQNIYTAVKKTWQNGSTFHSYSWNCSSRYLANENEYTCVRIKKTTFVTNSRPWNFVQNVYLFPPRVNSTFPTLWRHDVNRNDERYIPRLPISLLILDTGLSIFSWVKYYMELTSFYLSCTFETRNREMLFALKFYRNANQSTNIVIFPTCSKTLSVSLLRKVNEFEYIKITNDIDTELAHIKSSKLGDEL